MAAAYINSIYAALVTVGADGLQEGCVQRGGGIMNDPLFCDLVKSLLSLHAF